MNHGKRLEHRVDLDATVEEVWTAVATGPGFSAWFVPHRFEHDDDGKPLEMVADFGSGNTDSGRILIWEPEHRVVYGNADESNTEVLEFIVEGKDTGSTVLRLVQSGVQGEDWEMEHHRQGWHLFFTNLQSYFTYFRGQPARNALVMGFTSVDAATVWSRFHTALGTDRGLAVGDPVDLTPDGVEAMKGVVDVYAPDTVLGIRTDTGLYRFNGRGAQSWGMANAFHYHYGTDVDATEWTQRWQEWLDKLFPPEEAPSAAD